MAFSPNGVCMPNSEPEPDVSNEPALIGHDTSWGPHEEVQSDGGLLKFFRGGNPVERCLQDPNLRQHVTDADFCKRLRKLRTQAEAAKTPEEISCDTRAISLRAPARARPCRGVRDSQKSARARCAVAARSSASSA